MATVDTRNDITEALQQLIDKEAVRELVLCYSRAIDRKDFELLRDLYTDDAIDRHGPEFEGDADSFVEKLRGSLPGYPYTAHHVCNHLISVDGDEANGEVYALALHCIPDEENPTERLEDFLAVRYIDNYRRCSDGKWRFSVRNVSFDMHIVRPFDGDGVLGESEVDPSYEVCRHRLFQRGARA